MANELVDVKLPNGRLAKTTLLALDFEALIAQDLVTPFNESPCVCSKVFITYKGRKGYLWVRHEFCPDSIKHRIHQYHFIEILHGKPELAKKKYFSEKGGMFWPLNESRTSIVCPSLSDDAKNVVEDFFTDSNVSACLAKHFEDFDANESVYRFDAKLSYLVWQHNQRIDDELKAFTSSHPTHANEAECIAKRKRIG